MRQLQYGITEGRALVRLCLPRLARREVLPLTSDMGTRLHLLALFLPGSPSVLVEGRALVRLRPKRQTWLEYRLMILPLTLFQEGRALVRLRPKRPAIGLLLPWILFLKFRRPCIEGRALVRLRRGGLSTQGCQC